MTGAACIILRGSMPMEVKYQSTSLVQRRSQSRFRNFVDVPNRLSASVHCLILEITHSNVAWGDAPAMNTSPRPKMHKEHNLISQNAVLADTTITIRLKSCSEMLMNTLNFLTIYDHISDQECKLRVKLNEISQINKKKSILDFPTKSLQNTLTVSSFLLI